MCWIYWIWRRSPQCCFLGGSSDCNLATRVSVFSPSNTHGLGGFRNPNGLFALLCLVCNEGLVGRERSPSVGILEVKIRDVHLGSQDFVRNNPVTQL